MRTYILKRLLLVGPTMLGITLISYVVMRMAPGDPARMKVSPGAGGEQQADKEQNRKDYKKALEQFDLDKPWHMQYTRWLGRLMGVDVQVWSADKACTAEIEKILLERFTESAQDRIEKRRTKLEGEVQALAAKRKGTWTTKGNAQLATNWKLMGLTGDETLAGERSEPIFDDIVPLSVNHQLDAWVQAQAKKERYKHIKEIDGIRAKYISEHGEAFDTYFEYDGIALNRTKDGRWYPLDFGASFKTDREVREILYEKLPVSMELSLLSIFFAYIIAIPLGIHSAVSKGSFADQVITTILFVLYSLPSFWVAIMLLLLVSKGGITDDSWQIFPVSTIPELFGNLGPNETQADRLRLHIEHLILPVTCLTYASFAYISRQMRAGMLDVIRSDFIRTARAKGVSETVIVFKHALRNSLIPILTIVAVILPALVGGSVIIETIFNIDGIGKLSFDAILTRDYSILMAVFTLTAFLTLIGILLSDLLYAVVDPRISFGGK